MPAYSYIDRLEAAMRFVYARFLEEDESIEHFMVRRTGKRPKIRHVVRRELYLRYGVSLQTIGQAEKRISGKATNHTTISHSINYVLKNYKAEDRALREIERLVNQFEEYWQGINQSAFKRRLRHYNSMPKHVLALVLTISEEYGSADKAYNDIVAAEFKTMGADFFNKELS